MKEDLTTFTIAGPKGGVGKSLLETLLGVRATHEAGRVALIDLDEAQGTTTEWWTLRGRPVNPYLHEAEGTLDALVEGLRADKWDYCFIDGPPHEQDLIEMSVLVADVVLIPIKLSYFDASTVDSIIGMCRRRAKPYAFVVNEYDGRKAFENSNNIALAMLEGRGTILNSRISYDPKYRVGQIKGQTGAEISKALAAEVDALWTEVKQLAGVVPALKTVEGRRHG
jgi:cellulose biosynthesis protein BcsQ